MFWLSEQVEFMALPTCANYEEFAAWMDFLVDADLSVEEVNEMLIVADDVEGNIL